MLCFKFSLLLIILLPFNSFSIEKFSSESCLKQDIQTEISHSGKFFGLLTNTLKLKKSKCIIDISLKTILTESWKVDLCKEPIHIKYTDKGSEEVYKKKRVCSSDSKDKFCKSWKKLKSNIQDHGLIFAEGERETLDSIHGQAYCIYLLLNKYLEENVRFSTHKKPADIYSKNEESKAVEGKAVPSQALEASSPINTSTLSSEETVEEELVEGRF